MPLDKVTGLEPHMDEPARDHQERPDPPVLDHPDLRRGRGLSVTGPAERLRADLTAAMRRRDRAAVSTLRSVLATIANAEAVPVADTPAATEGPVAGAVVGLGAAEAPRREPVRGGRARPRRR
ncbi:GatB/YqeY domain-containing protein [Nocardioides convexus]|uniref:GatB/YqeY domain-containing protein n=1 Tax=Nocardioides convexus TaxID=2712224 RepID=UPI002418B4EC|nr:GatB/YqeY domain-containing protein [Nocardioides convexus]